MDLIAVVKQKNDQLSAQHLLLQEHLVIRASTPHFRSFVATFIIAPLIVGAVARLVLGSKPSLYRHIFLAVLPRLKFWSLP